MAVQGQKGLQPMLHERTPKAQEKRERLALDRHLSRHGYRLADRPQSGEPWWINPQGYLVSLSVALEEIRRQEYQQYQEDCKSEGKR
jgi:hypothetical protein